MDTKQSAQLPLPATSAVVTKRCPTGDAVLDEQDPNVELNLYEAMARLPLSRVLDLAAFSHNPKTTKAA